MTLTKFGTFKRRNKKISGKSPVCPSCGGLLKPDIIFFGEPL
ncbi:MAG: Sir2 family NAD-dependent protein deacetylase, partial [Nitrososphaeria archaeon]